MEIEFKLTLEILIGLIGSMITTYFIFYKNIKSNLQQSIYREEKIKLLSTHKLEQKYKISLKYIISWLDSIYQTSSFITNYSRHITIALCYSFFIFIIFWLLGTEGKVGSIQIINNLAREEKFLIVISLSLYSSMIFLFYNKNYSLKILIPILILGSITLEVILLNIGSYIGINFSGLILFVIMLLLWKKTIKYHSIEPLFGIFLILFGLLILLQFVFLNHINYKEIYTLGLFLIILPLINGFIDYSSVKISKYMSTQILKNDSILTILFHILIDLVIAVILLLILVFLLYFSTEILNQFIDKSIPIKKILLATWNNPFSLENGWITFMLLSTILPTMIHFVLALGALIVAIIPSEKSLKKLKTYTKGQEELLESAAHYFTRIAFIQTFFSFIILVLLSLAFWYDKL